MGFKHLNTRKCEITWANVLGKWAKARGDPWSPNLGHFFILFIQSLCLFAETNLE